MVDLTSHAPALADLVTADTTLLGRVLTDDLHLPATRDRVLRQIAEEVREHGLLPGLRRSRHRQMIRIALREVRRLADIDDTSRELADLAAACIEVAQKSAREEVASRFGEAVYDDGTPIPLVVMGMGKLGGGELNLGSDVDICFFHESDEGHTESGETSVLDFFARVARKTAAAIGDLTEHGFVFRVDLRLRPEGSQGALVNSLPAALRYYESYGRPWERAVWLRARPVAGDLALGQQLLDSLCPFVFPRRVDPTIADAMHEMVERSRRELSRHPERDVKLGRGGIREAEFFVQALQLIWGGVQPSLRVSGTIDAARRLESLGFIGPGERHELESAWALLRRVEHRIHMVKGYQTHDIPDDSIAGEQFAASLGLPSRDALLIKLGEHRTNVARLFDSIRTQASPEAISPYVRVLDAVADGLPLDQVAERARVLPTSDEHESATHLMRWRRLPEAPLGLLGRRQTPRLAHRLLHEVGEAPDPDLALRQLTEFLLHGGCAYSALLESEPRLLRRLVGLLGSSPSFGIALTGFPSSLGLLLSGRCPTEHSLRVDHAKCPLEFEECVRFLRQQHRTASLQLALACAGGELSVSEVAALLTRLAEEQIDASLRSALNDSPQLQTADFAVVGLGTLGARELDFASDLDLLFIHGTEDPALAGALAKLAQRILRLLSCIDAEGPGYEVDTRLRPRGSQGMLVVSLSAFERYHADGAQGWERQALLRARCVASTSSEFRRALDESMTKLAYAKGPADAAEVARLRGRIERELAGESAHRYHSKLGHGTLIDVEFLTQWLQMSHASDPSVRILSTRGALEALVAIEALSKREFALLESARSFFAAATRGLRWLDPSGDGRVVIGGPRASTLARHLGIRERDGLRADDALFERWRQLATDVRALFEEKLAPVGTTAPWELP
ncbi:MAG: glutamate-ammonia-ligase adenylyltransferase [Polyangiales bacterium]|jgi:glutamate-ammonia-ligase adenylyltransferase